MSKYKEYWKIKHENIVNIGNENVGIIENEIRVENKNWKKYQECQTCEMGQKV